MHFNLFDPYQERSSQIHHLDPRIKVLLALAFILMTVLLPDGSWLAFLLAWLILMTGTRLARIPIPFLLKRSMIAIPFALAAVTLLFTVPGLPLLSLPIGGRLLVISAAGLARFLSILLRTWLSVQAAVLLTATTPFPDILHALRHLRVPRILVSMIGFTYRYLFVIADEALRLLRARQARSAVLPGHASKRSLPWQARVAGNMAGGLFLRSLERSERVYNAMLARGFDGEFLTINPHRLSRRDRVFGAVALCLMLALLWFSNLF